jgi:hypothetical protein
LPAIHSIAQNILEMTKKKMIYVNGEYNNSLSRNQGIPSWFLKNKALNHRKINPDSPAPSLSGHEVY